jgi:hypothetical protein
MQKWWSQTTSFAKPAVIRKPSSTQAWPERHSTQQLESVKQLVDTLLHSNFDTARLDTIRNKQILRQTSEHLNPGATTQEMASSSQNSDRTHAPTKKKIYTEATSTTNCFVGPPRTHHNMTYTKPVPPPKSGFGQLTATLANTVRRILVPDWAAATTSSLRNFLGFSEKVAKYPTRYRVAIYGIPLRDVQEESYWSYWQHNSNSIISDWNEYNPLSRSVIQHHAATRFLLPRDVSHTFIKTKGTVSYLVSFDNVNHADRLIQEGAFIHGKHCKATLYIRNLK